MTKIINRLTFALLGGVAFLAAGCVKEAGLDGQYRPEGTIIPFEVGTGSGSGTETRTAFSGHFYATSGLNGTAGAWERIDWVNGDPVTIYYKHPDNTYTHANYTVSGNPTANADRSGAGVQPASGSTPLVWAAGSGQGSHVFTAVYPTQGFNYNQHSRFDGVQVKGFIPAQPVLQETGGRYLPDMSFATLVGYKSISASSTEQTVSIPFKPAFTAFEFRFRKQAGAAATRVMSFTLSSSTDDLAGPFSFSITGGDDQGAVWGTVGNSGTGSRSRTITVSFEEGADLSETEDLDFTILALPTQLTNLSVTIAYAGGSARTIALNDARTNSPVVFAACQKYVISNYVAGTSSWEYVIEGVDDVVTYGHGAASLGVSGIRSYRRGPNQEIEAVAWKAQYWDGTQWQDWTEATNGFSLNSYARGAGVSSSAASESRTVRLTANSTYQTPARTSTEILRAATPVSDYDLSRHDIHGNEYPDGKRTTANTYVVSAPGTYLIPCVYGNAITNGRTNYESFAPGGSNSSIKSIYQTYVATAYAQNGAVPLYRYPDVNYTPFFRNAVNTAIQNPYVIEDINANSGFNVSGENAIVIWQDAQIVNTRPTVTTIDGHAYIRFTIGAQEIKPGNVVIALRGNPGGSFTSTSTILWSWQVWVTEQDLHPIGTTMPANLGWHRSELGAQKYTDRSLSVRLAQILPADDPYGRAATEEFSVTQVGDSRDLGENIGSSPYYQWGRKDPMIPGIYSTTTRNFVGQPCTDKTIYPTSEYSGMTFYTEDVTISTGNVVADYGKAIRHPNIPYAGLDKTTSWISGYFPGWTYLADGQGGNGAGFAGTRSETAIPYNLWDAYCYGQGSDPDGTHKVKSVYDPCPPGFAVPYKNFAGNLGTRSTASDGSGVYYTASNGAAQFFPYSGSRIYYSANPSTMAAVTPGIYINELANSGLYWTDCPLNIAVNSSYNASNNWAGCGPYQNFQFAYIISMAASASSTIQFTRGTAGTIRPVVYEDPNH